MHVPVGFLNGPRSAPSRLNSTFTAPAPSLHPATVGFASIFNKIIDVYSDAAALELMFLSTRVIYSLCRSWSQHQIASVRLSRRSGMKRGTILKSYCWQWGTCRCSTSLLGVRDSGRVDQEIIGPSILGPSIFGEIPGFLLFQLDRAVIYSEEI